MNVLQARVLGVCAAFVLGSVAIGCGSSVATPTTASRTAPPTVTGLPPELADAVEQRYGTFVTPDDRVFSAPDEFASHECGDVRWPAPDDTADRCSTPACRSTWWSG